MTGDQTDVYARLKRLLPPWFGSEENSPIVNALVQGAAWALSWFFSLYLFAQLQTRIATMSGGWLDLAAGDYFGDNLRRFGNENDTTYSRRIRLEILRDRNTRNAIDRAVFDLTGNHPIIFESWRPANLGGIGDVSMCLGVNATLGSLTAFGDVIITTPAPRGYGVPSRPGLNDTDGGLNRTLTLATDSNIIANGPTVSDVVTAIERVRPAGIIFYVRFT